MVFIIGGRCQGKLEFSLRLLDDRKWQDGREKTYSMGAKVPRVANGIMDDYEKAMETEVIYHLEEYIKRLMKEGENPSEFIEKILSKKGESVIIADEIGCGVVPADAFERFYRETDGRLCQKVAARADEVYRVFCGIGIKIK